jgi:hypothetical protein
MNGEEYELPEIATSGTYMDAGLVVLGRLYYHYRTNIYAQNSDNRSDCNSYICPHKYAHTSLHPHTDCNLWRRFFSL